MTLLLFVVDLYSLLVVVSVVLSWLRLSPDNPVVRAVGVATEPVVGVIRRILPDTGGIDFSPMLLLLLLQLLKRVLVGM